MSDQFCSVRFLNKLTQVSYKDEWLTCTVTVAHFHRDASSYTTVMAALRNRSMQADGRTKNKAARQDGYYFTLSFPKC